MKTRIHLRAKWVEKLSRAHPEGNARTRAECVSGMTETCYQLDMCCHSSRKGVFDAKSERLWRRELKRLETFQRKNFKLLSNNDRWQLRLLDAAGWFCGSENRAILAVLQRDLRIDEQYMVARGRGALFIYAALTFRCVAGGILPIIADGVCRLLRPAKDMKEVVK